MNTEQKKDLNQYYLDTYTKEASVYDQRRWTSKGGSKAKSLRNAYFFDILRKYNLIQPEKKNHRCGFRYRLRCVGVGDLRL